MKRAFVFLWCITAAFVAFAESGPGPLARVETSLTVRGDLITPGAEGETATRQPIDMKAAFDFVEPVADSATAPATRRYRRATAAVQVGETATRTTLAADARDVIVELVGTTPTPRLAESFLSRQEAELLDTPFDWSLLPRLAPDGGVTKNQTWKVPADVVAGLVAIDTVNEGGIEVTLTDTSAGAATMKLVGTVNGAVDGVATVIAINGQAVAQCVAAGPADTWLVTAPIHKLDVTLSEKRDAGWVAPGLDVEATVSMQRSEAPADPAWNEKHRLDPPIAGRPAGQGRAGVVWHRHPHGRYTLALDRRWRVVEDGPEGLVMRLVDRGAMIAQCSLLPLPRSAPEKPPTVEQVSRDVQTSLGEQFGLIATAEATTRDDGTHVVRVMAEGSAEGRAFCWIHHVFSDSEGHRAAVTCMFEPAMAERFGGADHELAAGLVLLDSKPDSSDTSGLRSGRFPAQGRTLSR